MGTEWEPHLEAKNPFTRETLIGRDFDPLNHGPIGSDKPLLDDDWGLWILRRPDGERVRRSMGTAEWEGALSVVGRSEFQKLPYQEVIRKLSESEITRLYRYIKSHHLVALDHLAAIRAILTPSNAWIWCVGLCHDEILALSSHEYLLARYRNQRGFLARIEFEPEAHVRHALVQLLGDGIRRDDPMDIEGVNLRAFGIGDALEQLGY